MTVDWGVNLTRLQKVEFSLEKFRGEYDTFALSLQS